MNPGLGKNIVPTEFCGNSTNVKWCLNLQLFIFHSAPMPNWPWTNSQFTVESTMWLRAASRSLTPYSIQFTIGKLAFWLDNHMTSSSVCNTFQSNHLSFLSTFWIKMGFLIGQLHDFIFCVQHMPKQPSVISLYILNQNLAGNMGLYVHRNH